MNAGGEGGNKNHSTLCNLSVEKKGTKIKRVCMRGRGLWSMQAEDDKI